MSISHALQKVRLEKPLVHHLTNWVTIYDCAQIVKSFGASPVMAHAKNEASEMASIASSIVLNIGTLTDEVIEAMILAGKSANKKKIPVIIDVCGAGATAYRDEVCRKLIEEIRVSVIKGNASEICRIAGMNVVTRGVDSGVDGGDTEELSIIAQKLSSHLSCVTVITGKEDVVADEKNVYIVSNGCDMMSSVVGTGCMAASVIGCFAAVADDIALYAAYGLSCYEIAAESAVIGSKGPMDFKHRIFDAVYNLDNKLVEELSRIRKR